MTKEQKSLLLALTLGDGCVKQMHPKKDSWVFHINHSVNQRSYIEWKLSKMKEIFKKNIKLTFRSNVKAGNGKGYDILTFSVVDKYFRVLRKFLYKNNSKRINATAIKRLDPLGLAILYLDDGSLLHRKTNSGNLSGIAVRLHLSLYEHEINPIIKVFKDKWDIDFKPYRENCKDNNMYLLYANTQNAIKFLQLVRSPIENEIKCMRYKIDTKYII